MTIQSFFFKDNDISVSSSMHKQNLPLICFHPDELQMFLLKHRCQRNRSAINRAINSPRLCAVSDQFRCESRLWNSARWVPKTLGPRQHVKESALRRMTFTSHGRDFKNKLPPPPPSSIRSRLLLHALHESCESWSEPSDVGRHPPGTKWGGWPHKWHSAHSKYGREIILHSVSTEAANLGEAVRDPDGSHRWLNHWPSLTYEHIMDNL